MVTTRFIPTAMHSSKTSETLQIAYVCGHNPSNTKYKCTFSTSTRKALRIHRRRWRCPCGKMGRCASLRSTHVCMLASLVKCGECGEMVRRRELPSEVERAQQNGVRAKNMPMHDCLGGVEAEANVEDLISGF